MITGVRGADEPLLDEVESCCCPIVALAPPLRFVSVTDEMERFNVLNWCGVGAARTFGYLETAD